MWDVVGTLRDGFISWSNQATWARLPAERAHGLPSNLASAGAKVILQDASEAEKKG